MQKFSRALFALLLVLFNTTGYAQPHIEKSEAFDEPDDGYNKVLLMKNGTTFYFHFAKKQGIEINVYDKSRKLTATQEISSEMWDTRRMRKIMVVGLYEIRNEAVLFVVETEGRTPTLYRMRFNGTTGALVKEDELGSSAKSKAIVMMSAHTATNSNPNTIFVEKDPESDCYAAIFFNGFSKDPDEKIRVIHYDGSHNKINAVTYDSPDDNFKYLRYIGAVVDGDKRLFLASYGASNSRGGDGRVFVSSLKAGDKAFVNKALSFTEDFKDTKSIMLYNHGTNSIQLLTMSFVRGGVTFFGGGTKAKYMSFMSYIDPETLDLKSVKSIAGEKINEYAHTALNTDLNYTGLPQNMIINKDNSTTILSEELKQEIVTYYTSTGAVSHTTESTYMGGIGVNELTAEGNEKSGYWIRKMQKAGGLYDPLYISDRTKGRWTFVNGNAEHNSYLSYDYINTDKNRYIIFNDDDRNFDQEEEDKKRKVVVKIGKLNTICYSLNSATVNKFFLFGEPGDKQSSSLHIDASDYDKNTNTYSTIMVERDGRDRSARLVWVKFD